ncbi:MAG: hypothetical protein Q9161_002066 [Pseudevernia consocians]
MAKRRNATDVGSLPSKQKLSTEVSKIANAITGIAKNPFAEKRTSKPAAKKPKPAKTENPTTANAKHSSTATTTTPAFVLEPPPPTTRTPRPITTKLSAAYGASGATGVTKNRKSSHAQTPLHQQNISHAKNRPL